MVPKRPETDLFFFFLDLGVSIFGTRVCRPGVISPLLTGVMLKDGNCPNSGKAPPSCTHAWSNVFLVSIGVSVNRLLRGM